MTRFIFLITIVLITSNLFSQNLDLPAPQKSGGMPLMEAFSKRSTSRSFDTKELTMQQVSNLLWAAFGVNRPDGKRTAPSARNYQETEIYVLLKQGTYIYDAKNNKLNQVLAEDIRALGGTQPFVKDAPLTLIYISDLTKMGDGNKESKMNTAYIDVGFISQNVYLFCASEGLVTGARGSVDSGAISSKLKLQENQVVILGQSVGYPKLN